MESFPSRRSIYPSEEALKPKKRMADKSVMCNWADQTTWHGVKDCYHSPNLLTRILWLIVVIGCLAMAIFQIFGLVNAFLTAPHYITNVYLEDSDINEFPNITVCNLNRVNRTLARQLNFSANAISYFFLALPVSPDLSSVDMAPDKVGGHRDEWLHFVENSGLPSYDTKYLLRWLGHQCDATLLGCYTFDGPFDCCNHSVPIINSEYGLCWSVTPPITPPAKYAVQSMTGRQGGIKMFINVGMADYASDVMFNNYLEDGIVLLLDFNPYEMIHRNPIQISPGSRVSIALQNKVRITTKPRYEIFSRPCVQNGTLKYMKGPYSHRSCLEECYLDVVYKACGCLLPVESKLHAPTCSADQNINCAGPAASEALSSTAETGALSSDCLSSCREPCEQEKDVDISVTSTAYPSKAFIQPVTELLASNGNKFITEEVIKNLVLVNLFFPSRGFTIVEKAEKTPLFELVANIGGQMGLWMGASIVTVIQAVYYFTGRPASKRSQ